jgi:hypothetical protein|nr:MAG TPA: hypothetical protein [Microviridae sp.]
MIIEVILGRDNIEVVNFYLFLSFQGIDLNWLVPFLYGPPASLHFLSFLSVQPAGGTLWGEQGSLNLYVRAGANMKKTSAVHGPEPWSPGRVLAKRWFV